jgi:hypothetical protein
MPDDMTPGDRRRFNWLVVVPLVIATLTLVSSFFQSVNYARNIDSAQRNVLRAEALKTCRDIIDVFFQFRLKAEEASHMQAEASPMLGLEMKGIVAKFGAYGTFLANFQDEAARKRYTELSWELLAIAEGARTMRAVDFAQRFAKAEADFGKLNEDCVKAAQARLL